MNPRRFARVMNEMAACTAAMLTGHLRNVSYEHTDCFHGRLPVESKRTVTRRSRSGPPSVCSQEGFGAQKSGDGINPDTASNAFSSLLIVPKYAWTSYQSSNHCNGS